MASKASAQAKLNKVVRIIAEAMTSEVCSIYLLRDGVLELFATLGLNQSAVHVTKLAMSSNAVIPSSTRWSSWEISASNVPAAVKRPTWSS